MSQIRLEVGKTYEVRNPERAQHKGRELRVKIISFDPDFSDPYLGDNDTFYCEDGRMFKGIDSPYDLVREVTP